MSVIFPKNIKGISRFLGDKDIWAYGFLNVKVLHCISQN